MLKQLNHTNTTQNELTPIIAVFDHAATKSDFDTARQLWNFSNEKRLGNHNGRIAIAIYEILNFAQPNEDWSSKDFYYIECENEADARQAYVMIKLTDLKLSTAIRFKRDDHSMINDLYLGVNRMLRMGSTLDEFTRTNKLFVKSMARNVSKITSHDYAGQINDIKQKVIEDQEKYRNVVNHFLSQARF